MDINNAIQDYVQCITNNAVTTPTGGTWLSALCLYYNITEPVNGSWIQAYCEHLGINAPINSSWTIALANYYSIAQPKNGTWWWAIADDACNGGGPVTPCIWGSNLNEFGSESRIWSATTPCSVPILLNWENQANNWEVEVDNWEVA